MIRVVLLLALTCATVVTSTTAMARSRHDSPPPTDWYQATGDPNAVFVDGTYAGSDPDPNIRAALRREFGRRGI
jgi:hypothetical protein